MNVTLRGASLHWCASGFQQYHERGPAGAHLAPAHPGDHGGETAALAGDRLGLAAAAATSWPVAARSADLDRPRLVPGRGRRRSAGSRREPEPSVPGFRVGR